MMFGTSIEKHLGSHPSALKGRTIPVLLLSFDLDL